MSYWPAHASAVRAQQTAAENVPHQRPVSSLPALAALPPLQVEGWALPELPPLITDILISLDDK